MVEVEGNAPKEQRVGMKQASWYLEGHLKEVLVVSVDIVQASVLEIVEKGWVHAVAAVVVSAPFGKV